MVMTLPRQISIRWLRERYLNKDITPMEVLDLIVRRAQEDESMNIWITPPSLDSVRPYLDRLTNLNPLLTPLWGIPFAVKDNIDVAGMSTTAGCPEFTYQPTEHATVVQRLIQAGAIPLGKTNMDQFATGLVGTRSPYGETHNAIHPELISGGSSSGSAVAVARGHASFALGTDTAGSGRVPAALNRIIGYKPSLGAWPISGIVPACASLDCVTVFTDNTADSLAVDKVLRGFHDADPWSRQVPHPAPQLPSKICLPKQSLDFYGPHSDAYSNAWRSVLEWLEHLGLPVEYVDIGLFSEAGSMLYEGPWVAERWTDLGEFIISHPNAALSVTEQVLRTGTMSDYDATSVFQSLHRLQVLRSESRQLLKDAVLVMPTTGGTWTRDQVRNDPMNTNRKMGMYTNHCNLLELCAIAVPSIDAMPESPFGITIFGLSENENLIFGAATLFDEGSTGQVAHVYSSF